MTLLLIEARRALGVGSQGDLGKLLGSSRRTGQRWEGGGSTPSTNQLLDLARRVHPRNHALAEEIAAAAGSSLERLGIVPPAPAVVEASPPPARLPAVEDLVDSVVCAAADAIDAKPRDVRPALLAAFARAHSIGLSPEAVATALGGGSQRAEKKQASARDALAKGSEKGQGDK